MFEERGGLRPCVGRGRRTRHIGSRRALILGPSTVVQGFCRSHAGRVRDDAWLGLRISAPWAPRFAAPSHGTQELEVFGQLRGAPEVQGFDEHMRVSRQHSPRQLFVRRSSCEWVCCSPSRLCKGCLKLSAAAVCRSVVCVTPCLWLILPREPSPNSGLAHVPPQV